MSISLKVVKLALVFWDSFRRLAMVCLILFILTRVSNLVPVISEGAFLAVVEPVGEPEAAGAVFGAAWGAGLGGAGVLAFGAAAGSGVFSGAAYRIFKMRIRVLLN